ncbi:hypothetical protein MalM25_02600 [Planctomycetes bacterium MalM25]|nr:hypothetical protein MalM25_02600 [Planctomycetes bacterium MalM25]
MPMPREEEDDLFHDVSDVDFVDDDGEEKPKKKTAKKKAATKKAPKKKTAKKTAKKTTKKKAARIEIDDAPAPKKAPKRRKKKAKPADEPVKPEDAFGAGLFGDEPDEEVSTPVAETPAEPKPSPKPEPAAEAAPAPSDAESTDEYGRPEPVANYVVHVYELGRLKRTIARDFTPEAAEAYATEFSRTSKRYGRQAVAGKKDTQPVKELEPAES